MAPTSLSPSLCLHATALRGAAGRFGLGGLQPKLPKDLAHSLHVPADIMQIEISEFKQCVQTTNFLTRLNVRL